MIHIERGVKLLDRTYGSAMYPFTRMEVGDSFFVNGKTSNTLLNASYYYSRNSGKKFTTRTVTENGVKGARIWRIA